MADKKAGPTPDDIMAPAEMKPLLIKSKQEPVNCAIGLTEDKLGVVLLHRRMKPKKLLAELKKKAKDVKLNLDAGSLRFGTAEVDPDIDSALVRFKINKNAPGTMEPKLREHIKKSGFTKVEIVIDESLEEESEDETEAEDGSAAAQAAPPPPPPPQQPQQQQPDAAALARTLTQLVQQIPTVAGGNAAVQQPLVKLAGAAQASLKGGDLAAAADGIDELRRALAAAAEQAKLAQQAESGGGAVTYAKSRLAWLAARKKVESEIEKLRGAIVAAYQDEGIAPELEKAYRERVAPVLTGLDERLADKLDAATNETDPNKRAALVAEAKQIMADYQAFLASEKIIADLDDNPFVPLAIRQTVSATLATLAKAVH
jgi:hypothetical protein